MPDRTPALQFALDEGDPDDLLALAHRIADDIDIIEVGTPLVIRHGLPLVERVRAEFPGHRVLADLKIMDAAQLEASSAFEAGADLVTVLAVTDDATIGGAVEAARAHGGQVVADMMCVADLAARGRRLAELGVDVLAVHTGVDQQAAGRTPLDDLRTLTGAGIGVPVAVAGGIGEASLPDHLPLSPAIVIVGGGITNAADPVAAAHALRTLMDTSLDGAHA